MHSQLRETLLQKSLRQNPLQRQHLSRQQHLSRLKMTSLLRSRSQPRLLLLRRRRLQLLARQSPVLSLALPQRQSQPALQARQRPRRVQLQGLAQRDHVRETIHSQLPRACLDRVVRVAVHRALARHVRLPVDRHHVLPALDKEDPAQVVHDQATTHSPKNRGLDVQTLVQSVANALTVPNARVQATHQPVPRITHMVTLVRAVHARVDHVQAVLVRTQV